MSEKYVFIIGLPRTGTKLLRNILHVSKFTACNISRENFFLGHSVNQVIRTGVRHIIRKIGIMSN